MTDRYLYADIPVLRNKLDIRDEKMLDMIEAEQSLSEYGGSTLEPPKQETQHEEKYRKYQKGRYEPQMHYIRESEMKSKPLG